MIISWRHPVKLQPGLRKDEPLARDARLFFKFYLPINIDNNISDKIND